jgi:hypothetical protein
LKRRKGAWAGGENHAHGVGGREARGGAGHQSLSRDIDGEKIGKCPIPEEVFTEGSWMQNARSYEGR